MTSGNGWPGVIKVPAQKVEHDPLCPTDQNLDPACWFCDLIAKVRDDERIKALFTASTVHRDEWADLRAQVEVLRDTAKHVARTHEAEGATTPALQDRAAAFAYATVLTLFDGSSDE